VRPALAKTSAQSASLVFTCTRAIASKSVRRALLRWRTAWSVEVSKSFYTSLLENPDKSGSCSGTLLVCNYTEMLISCSKMVISIRPAWNQLFKPIQGGQAGFWDIVAGQSENDYLVLDKDQLEQATKFHKHCYNFELDFYKYCLSLISSSWFHKNQIFFVT